MFFLLICHGHGNVSRKDHDAVGELSAMAGIGSFTQLIGKVRKSFPQSCRAGLGQNGNSSSGGVKHAREYSASLISSS
jgi:hypothetical protein